MTRYEAWFTDCDKRMFDTLEEAEAYMQARGYEYYDSMACEHPTEERDYYVRDGETPDDYPDGYCPCITPIEEVRETVLGCRAYM